MKLLKKSAALLLAVLLFAAAVPTVFAAESGKNVVFTEVNETVYATGTVNIRTGPSISFTRIGSLPKGQAIQRIAVGDNGWSKVVYKGETAYISSAYLSTDRPVINDPDVDYSKLTRQIAIANGLNKTDYTMESWEVLSDALTQGISALNSDSQTVVDRSEKALEEAVTALVRMDRSALEEALAAVQKFTDNGEKNELWFELVEAANNGETLLASNDQAAVDEAVIQINGMLAAVQAYMTEQGTPEIVTQEVMVEVPPADDYCNISMHRVWPVLFFCSLALNVVLVAMIVIYVSRKKKNQKDDTPLVDYDISDDLF